MLFMGIDIGTTNVKISLYNEQGKRITGSQFNTPRISPQADWYEYEPEVLWDELSKSVALLLAEGGRGNKVASIAISSQAETGLLVDQDNRPLTNMIAWYDKRTIEYLERWEERISAEELFRITGLQLHYIPSLLKLEWIKDHLPDVYHKADRWHCVSDYITRKLCGVQAMDYSLASRTMAFDVEKGQWSEKLLALAGIRPELLPPLLPAGTLLGNVLSEVAAAWGIHSEAKVAVGGHDHPCGCIGLGANQSNRVITSIGTTESVCLFREMAGLEQSPVGYTVGRHVYPDVYYWLGGIPSGGETIDWAIRLLLHKEPDPESYAEFIRLAEASVPGSHGVLFLPQLKGSVTPVMDPDSTGGFWGLRINTRREDLCRAVIEGLSFEFRLVLEQAGMNVNAIIAMGGGSKNTFWMQCKANVLNMEVRTLDMEDTVTFGAALLGGQAAQKLDDQTSFTAKAKRTFYPEATEYRIYEEIYQKKYKRLYGLQKTISG